MPSFSPTRNYLFKLTEEVIVKYGLTGPFLEVGCGDGAFSVAFARRGWRGVALDTSEQSAALTRESLLREDLQDCVQVRRADFMTCTFEQKFNVVVLYDVLEHVAQDRIFLKKIRAVLADGGFLLFSVPVKMKEWRWDDDDYGHLRRYENPELKEMLDSPAAGFEKLVQWDITFPVLWIMRRVYLSMFSPTKATEVLPIEAKTERSAFVNAGGNSILVRAVASLPGWPLAYWLQDRFREKHQGCNTLILARAVSIQV